jgi:hypothetical protein
MSVDGDPIPAITDAQPSAAARRAIIATTICKSGRFETGQGTCAAICMDVLGSARRACPHATRVHGALAQQIDEALSQASPAARAAGPASPPGNSGRNP